MNGMSGSANRRETSFKGQNFEAIGFISDSDITADDLATNKFVDAVIQEWIVDWKYPFQGFFLYSTFTIRDHEFDGQSWKAQVEGPMSKLEQTVGETYTPGCRHRYGEPGCNRILDDAAAASRSIAVYNENGVSIGSYSVNGYPQLQLNKLNQPLGPDPNRRRWMVVPSVRVATPPPGKFNTNTEFYLNTADVSFYYSEPVTTPFAAVAVTFTAGTPGIVNATAHGLQQNLPVKFSTAGSIPPNINPGVTYYVHDPAANTFKVTSIPGNGSPIAFSTAGAGGPHYMILGDYDYWELQRTGGWFTGGRVMFQDGVLASTSKYEIAFYDHPYKEPYIRVVMRVPLSKVPVVGNLVTLYAGCSKSFDHCRGKANNAYFFGGFIFIPGPDRIYQRPSSI